MRIYYILYALIFLVNASKAQELEPNGDFDNDIVGWHCGNGAPTWISNDGSALSGNGSLQHTITGVNATGGSLGAGYCDFSTANAAESYIFKGSYKLLTADEVKNLVFEVYFYTQNETFIDVITEVVPINTITLNQWISFNMIALAPANTAKVITHMNYEFTNTGNPINMVIHWDDMSLKQKVNIIFMNGFE